MWDKISKIHKNYENIIQLPYISYYRGAFFLVFGQSREHVYLNVRAFRRGILIWYHDLY